MMKPNGRFDKYLLSFFVIFFALLALVLSERFKDQNLAVAMMDNAKLFVGALLGAITAQVLDKRRTDQTPENTPPPTPPPAS